MQNDFCENQIGIGKANGVFQWNLCLLYMSLSNNMLNCFEDYERYIHTLNCTLDLAWPK